MKRTAQSIEAKKSGEGSERKRDGRSKNGKHPNSRKNLKEPWPKGLSGNPGGLPGTDLAAQYARKFFEGEPLPEHIAEGLKGFNAYAFNVLADRGYGKVKEVQQVEHSGELAITIKMVKTNAE